uniref:G protein-coupled receptor n=1 Tax=Steinernema glaseri TaxID=37863 RepID=A0A1I7ZYY7_9BILA
MFAVGYLWTSVAVPSLFPRLLLVFALRLSPEYDYSPFMIIQDIITWALYIFMLILYVWAILGMRKRIGESSTSSIAHRKALKSVLIYCTPPNVFVFMALCGHTCDTVLEVSGVLRPSHWSSFEEQYIWITEKDPCAPVRIWSQQLVDVRIFVSLFTALCAFHDYRVAVKRGVHRLVAPICKKLRLIEDNPATATASSSDNALFIRTSR